MFVNPKSERVKVDNRFVASLDEGDIKNFGKESHIQFPSVNSH